MISSKWSCFNVLELNFSVAYSWELHEAHETLIKPQDNLQKKYKKCLQKWHREFLTQIPNAKMTPHDQTCTSFYQPLATALRRLTSTCLRKCYQTVSDACTAETGMENRVNCYKHRSQAEQSLQDWNLTSAVWTYNDVKRIHRKRTSSSLRQRSDISTELSAHPFLTRA